MNTKTSCAGSTVVALLLLVVPNGAVRASERGQSVATGAPLRTPPDRYGVSGHNPRVRAGQLDLAIRAPAERL